MDPYTAREERSLLKEVGEGAANPVCPRCGGACAVIRARPRRDVSYVRDRVVVKCARCRRSCSADVKRRPRR